VSTVYLIPRPLDKLGRKHRESGWRCVPFDREARKEMEGYAGPLRDKGITAVYCSDLDTKMAEVLGDRLKYSAKPDFQFRRFHVGRHHAADVAHVDRIIGELIEKWKQNPAIPIRGGDSLMSFEKRFVERYKRLLREEGTFALIADVRMISVIRDLSLEKYAAASLAPNGNAPKMDRIYMLKAAA